MGFFGDFFEGVNNEPVKPPSFADREKEEGSGVRKNDGGKFMAVPGPDNDFTENEAEILGIKNEIKEIEEKLNEINNMEVLTNHDEKERSKLEHKKEELLTRLKELNLE